MLVKTSLLHSIWGPGPGSLFCYSTIERTALVALSYSHTVAQTKLLLMFCFLIIAYKAVEDFLEDYEDMIETSLILKLFPVKTTEVKSFICFRHLFLRCCVLITAEVKLAIMESRWGFSTSNLFDSDPPSIITWKESITHVSLVHVSLDQWSIMSGSNFPTVVA